MPIMPDDRVVNEFSHDGITLKAVIRKIQSFGPALILLVSKDTSDFLVLAPAVSITEDLGAGHTQAVIERLDQLITDPSIIHELGIITKVDLWFALIEFFEHIT